MNFESIKMKNYLHFDHKPNINWAKNYVTNKNAISNHSFLPFLKFTNSFEKRIQNIEGKRPVKLKERHILYASHLDNIIYKYYSEILNNHYNFYCFNKNINNCVTAYRNNRPGYSNIKSAAEVINFIAESDNTYVIVGDFTKYFDSLDHLILKNNLKRVLGVSKLEDDWYNVYKSIVKFGYYKKQFIEKYIGNEKELKKMGKKSFFNNLFEFRQFQKKYSTSYNRKQYGIPQGTAISAVLANVYAIDFDYKLSLLASKYSGLYRRYSDDFIIVLPDFEEDIKEIQDLIYLHANEHKIELQVEKTQLYYFENKKIVNENGTKSRIDYLGFIYNGERVFMRGKSPYKFYRNARKLISYAESIKDQKNLEKLPYRKNIYRLYTDLGTESGNYGNFISYTKRAQRIFDEYSPLTINLIENQIKNRKKKIEKRMRFSTF